MRGKWMIHTHEDVLEKAIWLDLVQWGLEKAFLVQVIFIIICKGAELLGLFIQSVDKIPRRSQMS